MPTAKVDVVVGRVVKDEGWGGSGGDQGDSDGCAI